MRINKVKKITAGVLTSALVLGLCTESFMGNLNAYAATEHWMDASAESTSWSNWKTKWETVSNNYQQVSLTPGVNETELNFAWYSKTDETPKVRMATKEDMSDAVEFTGNHAAITIEGLTNYISNKVTATGLKEHTSYYYQIWQNGAWQAAQSYTTKSFSNFSILYVGDPQIGACKGQTSSEGDKMVNNNAVDVQDASLNLAARNDSYNWDKTLDAALQSNPDVSFMISAGDQVNYGTSETEYAGYLGASALSSLPVATTIGNHDSSSPQYSLHYNNPNNFDAASADYTTGRTNAGTDYYYTYGDCLFIVLDTNNYNCATHENVMKKAVDENKDAKWRIVTFHQDIYGSGLDHSDSDGIILRTQLTPLMDKYDIDVVLQGHDHTYSRTYQLTSDGSSHSSYDRGTSTSDAAFKKDNICYDIKSNTVGGTVVNPEGTVYVEANSATGSKFYNLIASQQDYISERSQSWTPTYQVIDVTPTSFSISTYDVTTGRVLANSTPYTIVKQEEKAVQTLSGTSSYQKTTSDKAFSLNVTSNGNGTLTYTSSNEDVAIVSNSGKVSIVGTGTATITIKAAATDSYEQATKTVTITVKKPVVQQTQTLTGTSSYKKVYGSKAFHLGVKSKGNGALSYTTSNANVATVSKTGKVSIKGCGIATITVKASATSTYKAAIKRITITVIPKKQVVKLSSPKRRQITVKWTKDTKASGYQVVYASNKSFTKDTNITTISSNKTFAKTLRNMVKGRRYYVQVRSYKTVNGKKIYGAYSSIRYITCK